MMIARRSGTSAEDSTSKSAPEIFFRAMDNSSAAKVSVAPACGER